MHRAHLIRADDLIESRESLEARMREAREAMTDRAMRVAISSQYPTDDWARFDRVEPAHLKDVPWKK